MTTITANQIRNAMLTFHHDGREWVVEVGIGGREIARFKRARDCQAFVATGNTEEKIRERIAAR